MAARLIILSGITAAAAGRRIVPVVTLALATSFPVLFLLVLELLFKGFHLLNGVVILIVASVAPTLAAVNTVLA